MDQVSEQCDLCIAERVMPQMQNIEWGVLSASESACRETEDTSTYHFIPSQTALLTRMMRSKQKSSWQNYQRLRYDDPHPQL